MLLAIDSGNTNIVFAIFDGEDLRGEWRGSSDSRKTADEYGIWLTQLMALGGFRADDITEAIIATVVPALVSPSCPSKGKSKGWYPVAFPPGPRLQPTASQPANKMQIDTRTFQEVIVFSFSKTGEAGSDLEIRLEIARVRKEVSYFFSHQGM